MDRVIEPRITMPGWRTWLAFASLALACEARTAEPDLGATLSTRDRTAVAKAACAPVDAARIEARRERPGSQRLQVDVRCQPHGTEASVPVARQRQCSNAAATWQCEPRQDVLQVRLSDASVLPVIANGVSSQAAVEAVSEASKLTIRPFYRPAIRVMKGDCSVRQGAATTRRGMENFRIDCGETVIFLTRDCYQGKCRHFIPFALNY